MENKEEKVRVTVDQIKDRLSKNHDAWFVTVLEHPKLPSAFMATKTFKDYDFAQVSELEYRFRTALPEADILETRIIKYRDIENMIFKIIFRMNGK